MKKNNYILLICIFVLGITATGVAQQFNPRGGSPIWIVDMFFKQSHFPDKENYLSGEMVKDAKNPTIGETLFTRKWSRKEIEVFIESISVEATKLQIFIVI